MEIIRKKQWIEKRKIESTIVEDDDTTVGFVKECTDIEHTQTIMVTCWYVLSAPVCTTERIENYTC